MAISAAGCNGSRRVAFAAIIDNTRQHLGRTLPGFPIQHDEHLLMALRYVEQNPIRLKSLKLRKPERWPWSSIGTEVAGVERPANRTGAVAWHRNWPQSVR
jgi:hypothetical protein